MLTDVLVLGIARVRSSYSVAGMTTEPDPVTGLRWVRPLKQGLPLQKEVRAVFSFEAAGSEQVEGHETLLVRYEQRGQIWTHRRYASAVRKFKRFAGPRLPFDGLTPTLLRRYEDHLAGEDGNAVNTIATTLNVLRTIIRRAVAEGLLPFERNPFHHHRIRHERTDRVRLSLSEVKKIEGLELEPRSALAVARDVFLLQFYGGGVRIGDALTMAWRSVEGDTLTYVAGKTKKRVAVPLVPQARAVLARYHPPDPDPDALVFPLLQNADLSDPKRRRSAIGSGTARMNAALKDVAKLAEIGKNLTTHVARHSFADLARIQGWSLYDIARAMRHSNVRVTERYLAGFDTGGLEGKMEGLFGPTSDG